MLQLALRFYDPHHGAISIDGHDLRDVSQTSLRRHIGVVFQDSVLLSGSIADNLRMAQPTASEAEMQAALTAANAWEFVSELPHGMHTRVGERGARLSGGQRQRLAIARVFLKDPAVMLLDEATAALDARSEGLVVDALQRLMAGRTAIIVAHRIATIRDADCIVVIENGRVIARGDHTTLRRDDPTYAAFCDQQRVA